MNGNRLRQDNYSQQDDNTWNLRMRRDMKTPDIKVRPHLFLPFVD